VQLIQPGRCGQGAFSTSHAVSFYPPSVTRASPDWSRLALTPTGKQSAAGRTLNPRRQRRRVQLTLPGRWAQGALPTSHTVSIFPPCLTRAFPVWSRFELLPTGKQSAAGRTLNPRRQRRRVHLIQPGRWGQGAFSTSHAVSFYPPCLTWASRGGGMTLVGRRIGKRVRQHDVYRGSSPGQSRSCPNFGGVLKIDAAG